VDLSCLLKTKIMSLPNCAMFNTPVNVIALKLHDYFTIVKRPMDLGTVVTNLAKQRYETLADALADIYTVFENACAYNPPGHPVHVTALSIRKGFDRELALMCKKWQSQMVARGVVFGPKVDFGSHTLRRQVSEVIKAPTIKKPSSRSSSPVPTKSTEVSSAANNKLARMQQMQQKSQLSNAHLVKEEKLAMLLRGVLPEDLEGLNLGGVNSIQGAATFASKSSATPESESLGINTGANANAVRAALVGQYMLGADQTAGKTKVRWAATAVPICGGSGQARGRERSER
jgi:hypothetical protein